jgi:hypothetical protein
MMKKEGSRTAKGDVFIDVKRGPTQSSTHSMKASVAFPQI